MEAEAAVQRQQMENMVKARMMEVEKHRRNFMQESQILSQRLAQMQVQTASSKAGILW